MALLRDSELVNLVRRADSIVEDIDYPEQADWFARDSPIQASSVDLHIGAIYVPSRKRFRWWHGQPQPRGEYTLKTGYTAVITTRETLHLPNYIAGIGFPPSRVSFKGLLMTNPGHVDPGYVGKMRFTVINMAREPYPLTKGARIVTVLFFRLDGPAQSGFMERVAQPLALPSQEDIDRLSHDFVDVERRAKSIATRRLTYATLLAAVVSFVVVMAQAFVASQPNWAAELRERVGAISASVDINVQQAKIEQLRRDLQDVKAATCRQIPRLSYCPPSTR